MTPSCARWLLTSAPLRRRHRAVRRAGSRWFGTWPTFSTSTQSTARACWRRGERHDEGTLTSARPEDWHGKPSYGAYCAGAWSSSPAERFESAPRRIEAEPGLVDLPQRVSLFGLTRLQSSHLDVLKAIAVHRDVHLFLLHPSHDLWEEVASRAPHPPPSLLRKDDRRRGCRKTLCCVRGDATPARCSWSWRVTG